MHPFPGIRGNSPFATRQTKSFSSVTEGERDGDRVRARKIEGD